MRRAALVLLTFPLLAASAIAQVPDPASAPLKAAEAEQLAADAETARLEKLASTARTEADRLRAEQAAAAQAMQAAEARISAANARLQLASAYVAAHRRRLEAEQQPVSDLLAGLATMARQPPLLVLADPQGTDELVKVRLLLDSTLPVIRSRTARLSAQLAAAGSTVGAHDLLIAATAIAIGYDVATRDERSFPRIPGLAVLRW